MMAHKRRKMRKAQVSPPLGTRPSRPQRDAGETPNGVRLSILYAEKGRQKKGGHRDPPLPADVILWRYGSVAVRGPR